MMELILTNTGKRFRFEWIFRGLDHVFQTGNRCAILGPNGSGKSTLMKVLAGHLTPSKGTIEWVYQGKKTDPEYVYKMVSYAAPYIELIEELTLTEAVEFHAKLKPFFKGMTAHDVVQLLDLPKTAAHKEIRFFSSGMKQRVKLALAVCSDTPVLLLDEPTTNLDVNAIEWYKNLVQQFSEHKRLVIIASNDPIDLAFCQESLHILDFK